MWAVVVVGVVVAVYYLTSRLLFAQGWITGEPDKKEDEASCELKFL